MLDFHYTVTTAKNVADAIAALEQALAEHKFTALWHLHINSKLAEKGFSLAPQFHVFEVCNAAKAKQALETNIQVGYFLPCKIVIYERDQKTHIGLLRPQMLMQMLGEPRLQGLADEVESELRSVVDTAAA